MSQRGKGQEAEAEIQRLLLEIMEGYADAVIPPFSYFSPNHERDGSVSRKSQKTSEASWAGSVLTERKRRELMSENFSLLQSMVPSLSDKCKPPREKIISDTLDYIKYLQKEIKRLEGLMKFQWKEQKSVLMKCANEKYSVKVGVSSGATFLAIELPFRSGLVLNIVQVLAKHQAEVLEARIDVNEQRILTFTATIRLGSDGGSNFDKIREELLTL